MEIVINGTHDGFGTLFSTNSVEQAHFIRKDLRPNSNTDIYLEKTFFDIRYLSNGYVFTKSIIIKDTLRAGATGRVAFSVFVDKTRKISGIDLLNLLDRLLTTYKNEFIENGFTNRGEHTLIRENFEFVNNLKIEYQTKETAYSQIVDLEAGSKEPAFIYYDSEAKMAEYFDKPYQEEYLDYKLIIFLDQKWKGIPNEDPIAILPNSGVDLTTIVQLDNDHYYLTNYNSSKGIKITANGKPRGDRNSNNCIRTKDIVEIEYEKDPQCFEPIKAQGTLLSDQIQKYLMVEGKNVQIKYEAFENPTPIVKEFKVFVKTRKNQKLDGVEIQIGTQPSLTMISEVQIIEVKGEDLKHFFKIFAKKDKFSGEITLDPLTSKRERELILIEEHTLKIIVSSDNSGGKELSDVTIVVDGLKRYRGSDTISFVGDDIDIEHRIEISHQYYEPKRINYRPNVQNETILEVINRKAPQKQYMVDAGDHGKLLNCQNYSSCRKDGSDVKDKIIPNKGYSFDGFVLNGDTLTAQYKKETPFYKKPAFIALISVGMLVFGVSIWWLLSMAEEQKLSKYEIEKYIKGDSLLKSKLDEFDTKWALEKPEIKKTGGSWLSALKFGKESEQIDSTDYKNWLIINNKIDTAIVIRNRIDELNFDEILMNISLKTEHLSKLKKAIKNIDRSNYGIIKDSLNLILNDIPNHTLSQIGDAINAIQNNMQKLKAKEKKKESELKMNELPIEKYEPKHQAKEAKTETQISSPKKANSLYTEFWDLVNKKNRDKKKYDELLKKYEEQNGDIKNFLMKIKTKTEFDKFIKIVDSDLIKAKKTTDLEDKMN